MKKYQPLFTSFFFLIFLAAIQAQGQVPLGVETQSESPQNPNYSVSLDGSGGHIRVPTSDSINITGPITLEAWIKTNSNTAQQGIIERYNWTGTSRDGGYGLRITADGRLNFFTLQVAGVVDHLAGSTVITPNVWHHVAGVFDGIQMRIYLDGVLDASKASTLAPGSGTNDLIIGARGDLYNVPLWAALSFNGLVDEVRVTSGARYLYNFTPHARQGGDGSDTRGLWNFSGQAANDSSGRGNNGSPTGGAFFSSEEPSVMVGEKLPPSVDPASGERFVSIDFDRYAPGTVITNHYPPAVFSANPNRVPVIWRSPGPPADYTTPLSPPNLLSTRDNFHPFNNNYFAPITVDFTVPVNNLRFGVASVNDNWGINIFQVDIYQNGTYRATWNIPSLGYNVNEIINIGQPANQHGYNGVTRIVIKNIRDTHGLSFDDFTFYAPIPDPTPTPTPAPTPTPLRVDIASPKVSGAITNTTQNALIGADLTLQARVSPQGSKTDGFSWEISGQYQVVSGSLTSSAVTIRYTQPGTSTVRVTLMRDFAASASSSATIRAVQPTLEKFNARVNNPPDVGYHLLPPGSGVPPWFMLGSLRDQRSGITFTAEVSVPAYISEHGTLKYVQIGRTTNTRNLGADTECQTTGEAWHLDDDPYTFTPYPQDETQALKLTAPGQRISITAADNPGVALDRDHHSASTDFEMYVVYFINGVQIPLGKLEWNYGGTIFRDASKIEGYAATNVFPTGTPLSIQGGALGSIRPYNQNPDLNGLPWYVCIFGNDPNDCPPWGCFPEPCEERGDCEIQY